MPTKPRPDSPYLASRAQTALGGRVAGEPSISGQPTPQTSTSAFPAPPAPNTAPPGRPPQGGQPTPAVPPNPVTFGQPSAPNAVPEPPPAAPVPQAPTVAPAPPSPVQRPQFGPGAMPVLTRQPAPAELLPGVPVQTPMGTVDRSANGEPQTTLSPEGQQRYKETVLRKRQELGPVPKVLRDIPGLPELPVEPGRWNYSPWTGIMKR